MCGTRRSAGPEIGRLLLLLTDRTLIIDLVRRYTVTLLTQKEKNTAPLQYYMLANTSPKIISGTYFK